jgi:hypothetical protein
MARRPDYTPRARGPRHRVHHAGFVIVLNPGTVGVVRLETEQCRCTAWRARVQVGPRVLWTDWSAPCSAPSPAPAPDEA